MSLNVTFGLINDVIKHLSHNFSCSCSFSPALVLLKHDICPESATPNFKTQVITQIEYTKSTWEATAFNQDEEHIFKVLSCLV